MDGPATNWKFFSLLVADRDQEQLPKLVNIGSCSLHTIHGAFKTAESTNWNLKATLKGAFQFLHDTPACRDDYTSVTGSPQFPLYFCATRWIEDSAVANRFDCNLGSHYQTCKVLRKISQKQVTIVQKFS